MMDFFSGTPEPNWPPTQSEFRLLLVVIKKSYLLSTVTKKKKSIFHKEFHTQRRLISDSVSWEIIDYLTAELVG